MTERMVITSADIAASIEATANQIGIAMATYQKCPRGGRVRTDLLFSLDQLHERLGHLLISLARKHQEER